MKDNKLHILRRVTQLSFILLIMLMPVFDVLRFDSDTRNLLVMGSEWNLGLREGFYLDSSIQGISHVTLQFFLKAILPWLGILAIFPFLGYITGRLFCGWLCPEGAIFELSDFFTTKILGRRSLFNKNLSDTKSPAKNRLPYIIFALLCIVIIPVSGGIALTGYFVNPRIIWGQIINWDFTLGVKLGIIGVSIYILISSIIVRHTLCKYVCSAGLMQMLFGWISPISLRIKVDSERLRYCTDCRNCEKVCFMNVKPRLPRRDINCVNCGECIEACDKELGRENGLFSFSTPKSRILTAEDNSKAVDLALDYKQQLKGG